MGRPHDVSETAYSFMVRCSLVCVRVHRVAAHPSILHGIIKFGGERGIWARLADRHQRFSRARGSSNSRYRCYRRRPSLAGVRTSTDSDLECCCCHAIRSPQRHDGWQFLPADWHCPDNRRVGGAYRSGACQLTRNSWLTALPWLRSTLKFCDGRDEIQL